MSGEEMLDGNGRLWEKFQLFNINDRIENLYVHLRDVVKEYAPEPPDYSSTINEIKQILNQHLLRVQSISAEWETTLNRTTLDNNALRDKIKKLKAKQSNYDQLQVLHEGINAYIETQTKEMAESLTIAQKERDIAYKQLEQQKLEHNASKQLMVKYKSKSDSLVAVINGMTNADKYNADNIDIDVVAERDGLQQKYNALSVKYQRKTFELDTYFSDQLNVICDTISKTEPFDAAKTRTLWKQDLDELSNIYQQRLNQKELEWQRAKNKSIKILDTEYKHLENRLNGRLELSLKANEALKAEIENNRSQFEEELKQKTRQNNILKHKMDEMKTERKTLQELYNIKANELIQKHQEMMGLQTQLSQYKILWEHFFGLDAPLKDEINECNAKLSKFERRHNIESNIPRKKRKVVVESLADWCLNHEYPPLMIDRIPLPNDEDQRMELFNHSKYSIQLDGFSIENQDGVSFSLDQREIRPNGYIVVALKQSKTQMDIKVPDNFKFEFKEKDKLFLCDSTNNKQQIFPVNADIYVSLEHWDESPLKATPFGDKESVIRGFTIENVTGREIMLINHYFSNKYGTFRKEIPSGRLKPSSTFRFITVRDDNPYAADVIETDIIVENDALSHENVDDALLLCDRYQNEFELYQLDESDDNHNTSNNNNATLHNFFVM